MDNQKDTGKDNADMPDTSFNKTPDYPINRELSFHSKNIATAMYLVTGLMDTDEPIKERLRGISLDLVSFTTAYTSQVDTIGDESFKDIIALIRESIALVEIAASAYIVSSMNAGILLRELTLFLENVTTRANGPTTLTSLDSIFSQTMPSAFPGTNGLTQLPPVSFKGQMRERPVTLRRSDKGHAVKNEYGAGERKERIISLIKEKGNVMIKDITRHIPNCSEKTIQRDLIDLVSQGLLEKRGERRWTTYFVPQVMK